MEKILHTESDGNKDLYRLLRSQIRQEKIQSARYRQKLELEKERELSAKKMTKIDWKHSPKEKDLPATRGMLHHVREELKSKISELRSEMKSEFKIVDQRFDQVNEHFNEIDGRFNQVDAKFSQVDARFSQIDARFNQVDARFDQVDAKFDHLASSIHELHKVIHAMAAEMSRMAALQEEEKANNRIVLEQLTGLFGRQDRTETHLKQLERTVGTLGLTVRRK